MWLFRPATVNWILSMMCFVVYFAMVFTVGLLTFRKGRIVLGIIGILFPILWLVGAVLPAKEGSTIWHQERDRQQRQVQEWTR